MAKEVILTREGYEELKSRLERLVTERRREVAERIKEAREHGDISENSEYDDAKAEQAQMEYEIAQLEEQLREARVLEESEVQSDVVGFGVYVTVKGPRGNRTFQIVGSAEADPDEDKISNESPVGKALMGRKQGESVVVTTPAGTASWKIVKIEISA